MKSITIKIAEELHKTLKIKMAEEGNTFNEYIVNLIEKDLSSKKEGPNIK